MNNAKLAVAVGAGYLLGRMHKARWALTLAGLAAGKRLSTNPGALLGQLLDSSPQLRELAGDVQGDLRKAGKKAAVAAASNRVNALTDQLERRTEKLRGQSEETEPEETEPEETEEPKEPEESKEPEEDLQDEAKPKRAPARKRSTGRTDTKAPARKRTSTSARKSSADASAKSTGTRASTRKRG